MEAFAKPSPGAEPHPLGEVIIQKHREAEQDLYAAVTKIISGFTWEVATMQEILDTQSEWYSRLINACTAEIRNAYARKGFARDASTCHLDTEPGISEADQDPLGC